VWIASSKQVSTLVSSGLQFPIGVAVDGAGNVYIGDQFRSAIKEYNALTGQVSTLVSSGLFFPEGVAVDAAGNVYIADSWHNAIKERVRAYVPGNGISESSAAGSDALLPVLPSTQPLTGLFAPSSDQAWLTIGTIANGVIHFSFTANSGPARIAHISVLGQSITVTQGPQGT
jgi:DNA-binding beta-propeller fold protein YncE